MEEEPSPGSWQVQGINLPVLKEEWAKSASNGDKNAKEVK